MEEDEEFDEDNPDQLKKEEEDELSLDPSLKEGKELGSLSEDQLKEMLLDDLMIKGDPEEDREQIQQLYHDIRDQFNSEYQHLPTLKGEIKDMIWQDWRLDPQPHRIPTICQRYGVTRERCEAILILKAREQEEIDAGIDHSIGKAVEKAFEDYFGGTTHLDERSATKGGNYGVHNKFSLYNEQDMRELRTYSNPKKRKSKMEKEEKNVKESFYDTFQPFDVDPDFLVNMTWEESIIARDLPRSNGDYIFVDSSGASEITCLIMIKQSDGILRYATIPERRAVLRHKHNIGRAPHVHAGARAGAIPAADYVEERELMDMLNAAGGPAEDALAPGSHIEPIGPLDEIFSPDDILSELAKNMQERMASEKAARDAAKRKKAADLEGGLEDGGPAGAEGGANTTDPLEEMSESLEEYISQFKRTPEEFEAELERNRKAVWGENYRNDEGAEEGEEGEEDGAEDGAEEDVEAAEEKEVDLSGVDLANLRPSHTVEVGEDGRWEYVSENGWVEHLHGQQPVLDGSDLDKERQLRHLEMKHDLLRLTREDFYTPSTQRLIFSILCDRERLRAELKLDDGAFEEIVSEFSLPREGDVWPLETVQSCWLLIAHRVRAHRIRSHLEAEEERARELYSTESGQQRRVPQRQRIANLEADFEHINLGAADGNRGTQSDRVDQYMAMHARYRDEAARALPADKKPKPRAPTSFNTREEKYRRHQQRERRKE